MTPFRRALLGAIRQVVDRASSEFETFEVFLGQFPFVREYFDSIDEAALPAEPIDGACNPLDSLIAACDLDPLAVTLFQTIGLIEEDPRFGVLFSWAQPMAAEQHRPTLALLLAWWREEPEDASVRASLDTLSSLGLIEPVDTTLPRLQWAFQVNQAVWDVLRGDVRPRPTPWLRFHRPDTLPEAHSIVMDEATECWLAKVPALIEANSSTGIVIRGSRRNGRRTLLKAVAKRIGAAVLEVTDPTACKDHRWRTLSLLATALHAMPLLTIDAGPGEIMSLPDLGPYTGPFGIAAGRHGSLEGPLIPKTISWNLELPSPTLRTRLWEQFGGRQAALAGGRFRMASGAIRDCATLAAIHARLASRDDIKLDDVRAARQALERPLETLASRVPVSGGWERIALEESTFVELRGLERRCRHRESLDGILGPACSAPQGVRALFSGPSGTGKTMAAQLLGSCVGLDLYRVDLAAVVNKYIGETEKNLSQLFDLAEELDVVLLLDEGDALLTARTAVQTSNDRYANLETNFLLQRIESFQGILLVTSNSAQRIDSAFQRRMDFVVEFRPPEPAERFAIWQLHLPANHRVDIAWLESVSVRCALTGGQIRNAVLHAALLAMDQPVQDHKPAVTTGHLEEGVRREYRKSGAACPLRGVWTGR